MAENSGCKHEICGCPSVGDTGYCSDHCRDAVAQDMVEIKCDCGCPGCS